MKIPTSRKDYMDAVNAARDVLGVALLTRALPKGAKNFVSKLITALQHPTARSLRLTMDLGDGKGERDVIAVEITD